MPGKAATAPDELLNSFGVVGLVLPRIAHCANQHNEAECTSQAERMRNHRTIHLRATSWDEQPNQLAHERVYGIPSDCNDENLRKATGTTRSNSAE